MSDIFSITQNPYSNIEGIKLLKNWQYVQALYDIGCRRFEMSPNGAVYIDGMPNDQITMAIIRTELRELDIKFRIGWLNDTILSLAHKNVDLDKPDNLPDWMRPPERIRIKAI